MSRAGGIVSVFAVGTGRLFSGGAICAIAVVEIAVVETDEISRRASAALRIQILLETRSEGRGRGSSANPRARNAGVGSVRRAQSALCRTEGRCQQPFTRSR